MSFHAFDRLPAMLLPGAFLFLLTPAASVRAADYTDKFNRPDTSPNEVGADWTPRGNMHIAGQALVITPNPAAGSGGVEAIYRRGETSQGGGKSFELSTDFYVTDPTQDLRYGLIFNWVTPKDFNKLFLGRQSLYFVAVKDGKVAGSQTIELHTELTPNTWYRLKVSGKDPGKVECTFSTVGDSPKVIHTEIVTLPAPPLSGGNAGVVADDRATKGPQDMKYDNFLLKSVL